MAAQVTGRVHSVESFGTVDGPGVRFVVFLQGCPMRCLYCHNPDTWDPGGGVPTTVEELLAQYARNEAFYRKGGITVTGGEPLLQIEFVTALFREAKRRGIHTCLDTSGATFRPEDAAALAQFEPTKRFGRMLQDEPAGYAQAYAIVLALCEDGATKAAIEQALEGNPALSNPKQVFPSYFISKLETVGGLTWDGSWKATEAGRQMLALVG